MSIEKIKETAILLRNGKLLSVLKTSGAFGYDNPYKHLVSLLKLIESYEEPKPEIVDPPKPKARRTRRTTKKEDSIE